MSARLRLATIEDAEQIRAIYAPIVGEAIISFETEPPTAEEIAARITGTLERLPWLVCDAAGEVLGYAYASGHRSRPAYRWAVDVSTYVREDARRGGVGRALYLTLLELLALQGYVAAYAGIALPNPGSVRFHEALGFSAVGIYRQVGYKLGAWHDVGWWQRELWKRPQPPHEPRTAAQLWHESAWREVLAAGNELLPG